MHQRRRQPPSGSIEASAAMHGFFLYTVLSFTGPQALGPDRERKREESYIPVSIISIQRSSFFSSLLPRLSFAPRRHFFFFRFFFIFYSPFFSPPLTLPLPANAAVRLALSALPDSGRSFLASLSYPFRLSFHTRGPSQSTLASAHPPLPALSSALLFPALVGKPSGPFARCWRARPGGI